MLYKASAPGSMMLLGEYAVLDGMPALVCALNKRVTVTVAPRLDDRIQIHSALLGDYHTTRQSIQIEAPFQFVLGALKHCQQDLTQGCDIHITSEFSDQIGFGSSAAVTVATLRALSDWLNLSWQLQDLLRHGRDVIRTVQGVGSGADVAASVFGGMVAYQAEPLSAEKMMASCPLTVIYSGFKTKTVDAIRQVKARFADNDDLFKDIIMNIGQCASSGIEEARHGRWEKLGQIMNIQQGLMDTLGVNLPALQELIDDLRKESGIYGAKISGSGLGDCVVGLGEAKDHISQKAISVKIEEQGVYCEKS